MGGVSRLVSTLAHISCSTRHIMLVDCAPIVRVRLQRHVQTLLLLHTYIYMYFVCTNVILHHGGYQFVPVVQMYGSLSRIQEPSSAFYSTTVWITPLFWLKSRLPSNMPLVYLSLPLEARSLVRSLDGPFLHLPLVQSFGTSPGATRHASGRRRLCTLSHARLQ